MNKKILIVLLVVIIIGIVGYFIFTNKTQNIPQTVQPAGTSTVGGSQTLLQKITCAIDDSNCMINNIINNFENNCQPVEVTILANTSSSHGFPGALMTISKGENGACHFQEKGLGIDQDCLFAKENVTQEVIFGMLGDTGSTSKLEFQKIKAESCK
jgi:hypothetical protein